MIKTLHVLSICVAANALSFAFAESPILNCRDGLDSSNTISILEDINGYEVSFKGKNLDNLELSRHEVYKTKTRVNDTIHVNFDIGSCNQKGKFISCTQTPKSRYNSLLFLVRLVRDRGINIPIIPDFFVDKISLLTSENEIKLEVFGGRSRQKEKGEDIQSISFKPFECNNHRPQEITSWGLASFPESLREYIYIETH